MSRSLHLLSATTALVALSAAAAHADTVTVDPSAVLSTDASTDGYLISNTVVVSSTTGAGINIDSANAAKNVITVGTGATISTSTAGIGSISATIDVAGGLIDISGSVINHGTSGKAIDLSLDTDSGYTINNSGTISGSIVGSGAADIFKNSGTITGAIDLGAGANLVSQTAGTITGDLTTGAGADVIDLYGGTLTGNIVAGDTGTNTITVSGSTVTGNITGGDATDTFNLVSGTVTGNVNLGTGTNTINISGGTLDGNLTGGGTETLNMSADHFTLTGTVDVNTLNVTAGITEIANTFSSASNAAVSAGATLGVSTTNTLGTVNLAAGTNGGKLLVDGDTSLTTGAITWGVGSQFQIEVASSTSVGNIITSGNLANIDNASLSIVMGSSAGYIASGTSFVIVDQTGGAATTTPTLLTTQNGLYSFNIARNGGSDISLTILRASTASLVTSAAGKGAAGALDALGASSTGDLATIQNNLTSASSAAAVNNIVESLSPATDTGSVLAGVNVGIQAGNNISNRLASLRPAGVATGSDGYNRHMWVQGFGNVAEQDDKDGNKGYDATTAGASFGMDTDSIMPGTTLGAAFSYANSKVDSNASNNAETNIDSYIATLYGSRVLDQGYFVNGQASLGFNQNESERQVVGFTTKTKGEYDSMQYGLKGEVGRDIAYGNMILTPLASLQYTYANPDSYTETGPAALTVDGDGFSALDAGLGGTVAWNMPLSSGGSMKPELRANYLYRMGDAQAETSSRFVAGGTAFQTSGVEADRSALNLGAGLTIASGAGMDVKVDYDADIRSSYTGHTGQVKLRWAF